MPYLKDNAMTTGHPLVKDDCMLPVTGNDH